MTGQDFQDKLDAVVLDLQTKGKGKSVNIMFRNPDNTPNVLPLSSDVNGNVNAAQLAAVQLVVDNLADYAGQYAQYSAPVQAASTAFTTARDVHSALIDAAKTSRDALSAALESDVDYQAAKTALENARLNQDYIGTRGDYQAYNVGENYAELQSAKGSYVGV